MSRRRGISSTRNYLRLHLWLRRKCDKLTIKQRKAVVYGLSFVYLVCSMVMIAQLFLPQKEEPLFIPKGELMDSPIQRDSLLKEIPDIVQHLAMNDYGE